MNMILITLSMFLGVVIIQTHIRGDRKNKIPPWLKRVSYFYNLPPPHHNHNNSSSNNNNYYYYY